MGTTDACRIFCSFGQTIPVSFVTSIIRKDAIHGVPDLVIEIISENDRPSDLILLEADYRMIGVPEILFIDPRKKRVRYLLKVEWLFADDKPDEFTITKQLIEAAESVTHN